MVEVASARSGNPGASRLVERVVAHYARRLTTAMHHRMEGIEAELNSLREENARLRTEIDVVRSEQNAVANRIGHLEASHAETVA